MSRSGQSSSSAHHFSTQQVSKRSAEPKAKIPRTDLRSTSEFTSRTVRYVLEDLGKVPKVNLPFTLTLPQVLPSPKDLSMRLPTDLIFGHEAIPYMKPLYTSMAPYFKPVTAAHGRRNENETLYVPQLAQVFNPIATIITLNGMPFLSISFMKRRMPMPTMVKPLMEIPSKLNIRVNEAGVRSSVIHANNNPLVIPKRIKIGPAVDLDGRASVVTSINMPWVKRNGPLVDHLLRVTYTNQEEIRRMDLPPDHPFQR